MGNLVDITLSVLAHCTPGVFDRRGVLVSRLFSMDGYGWYRGFPVVVRSAIEIWVADPDGHNKDMKFSVGSY